jgi:hypothetical protein
VLEQWWVGIIVEREELDTLFMEALVLGVSVKALALFDKLTAQVDRQSSLLEVLI